MRIAEALAAPGLDRREARLLLAEATGFSQASVLAHPERELPEAAARRFDEFAGRRRSGEPIAYITGRREFFGLEFAVTPAVLIPRHETELLVELALAREPGSVLDLGTGSGAIAIAIKHRLPKTRVVAVEASAAALAVARRNAAKSGAAVDFRHGVWFEPVAGERFDLVVSNPPYVAEGDWHLEQGDVRFEPRSALVSGPEGLDDIRAIAAASAAHLEPGGWLLLEHGAGQDTAVRRILDEAGLEAGATWPDLSGIPRVSGARVQSRGNRSTIAGAQA
jgi:release factor glutamine methyltransferase